MPFSAVRSQPFLSNSFAAVPFAAVRSPPFLSNSFGAVPLRSSPFSTVSQHFLRSTSTAGARQGHMQQVLHSISLISSDVTVLPPKLSWSNNGFLKLITSTSPMSIPSLILISWNVILLEETITPVISIGV